MDVQMVQDDPKLQGDSGEVPIFWMEGLAVQSLLWNSLSTWWEKTS